MCEIAQVSVFLERDEAEETGTAPETAPINSARYSLQNTGITDLDPLAQRKMS